MANFPRSEKEILAELRGENTIDEPASSGAAAAIKSDTDAGIRDAPEQVLNVAADGYKTTDYGNAERLTARHGEDIRYCPDRKTWYVWDGKRWAPSSGAAIERHAKDTVRHIYRVAADTTDSKARDILVKWAHGSESTRRLIDMVRLAQSEPGVNIETSELDADPLLFGCLNGVLDLDAGKLLPFDRKYFITKIAPVEFDPDAKFELWDRFLDTAMKGDAELIAFLARMAGCSLTALPADDDRFAFCHGKPGGGKSTFAEAIRATWGAYARAANFDTIVTHYNPGSPRGDIARLHDARLVTMVEIPDGKRLDETVLSQLTGGDTITSCFKYQNEFEYVAQFKLWVFGNNEPTIKAGDSPIWRRLLKVPFTNVIPETDRDASVKATLRRDPAARAAILAWAVRGYQDWRERGLDPPESVKIATVEYQESQDLIQQFMAECCERRAGDEMELGEGYKEFIEWCRRGGIYKPNTTKTRFTQRLKAILSVKDIRKSGSRRYIAGIDLQPDVRAQRRFDVAHDERKDGQDGEAAEF